MNTTAAPILTIVPAFGLSICLLILLLSLFSLFTKRKETHRESVKKQSLRVSICFTLLVTSSMIVSLASTLPDLPPHSCAVLPIVFLCLFLASKQFGYLAAFVRVLAVNEALSRNEDWKLNVVFVLAGFASFMFYPVIVASFYGSMEEDCALTTANGMGFWLAFLVFDSVLIALAFEAFARPIRRSIVALNAGDNRDVAEMLRNVIKRNLRLAVFNVGMSMGSLGVNFVAAKTRSLQRAAHLLLVVDLLVSLIISLALYNVWIPKDQRECIEGLLAKCCGAQSSGCCGDKSKSVQSRKVRMSDVQRGSRKIPDDDGDDITNEVIIINQDPAEQLRFIYLKSSRKTIIDPTLIDDDSFLQDGSKPAESFVCERNEVCSTVTPTPPSVILEDDDNCDLDSDLDGEIIVT